MKRIYIEFNYAPHIICVADDDGKVRRFKKVEIKGPSSVVSVKERNGIGQKQAWIEVQDGIEIMGVDERMNEAKAEESRNSNFYRQHGADAFFKKHLAHLIGVPGLRFLEIGSYAGSSAVGVIEDILTDPTSTITCVDVWYSPFVEKAFDEATTKYVSQIVKESSYSSHWLQAYDGAPFDFIYIDADHSAEAVVSDTKLSWPLLKPGGIMALDDYLYEHPKGQEHNPKSAIDAFILQIADQSQILEISQQVWIKKTNGHIAD